MPHPSNRTDEAPDLSILGGGGPASSATTQEQQPADGVASGPDLSILGGGEPAPSADTLPPSTPEEMPTGGDEDGGLLSELGSVVGTAADLLTPTRPREAQRNQAETAVDVAERAPEAAVRTAAVAPFAVPAGVERGIRWAVEEATDDQLPARTEVGGVEVSTKPFEELVRAGEEAQSWVRDFFGNDESQLLNLASDIAGGYLTADQIFKSASFVNKFVANRFSPALFRPISKSQGTGKALSQLSQAEQKVFARLMGSPIDEGQTIAAQAGRLGEGAERFARTFLASGESAAFVAGLPDTERQEIVLAGLGGLGLQGATELGGALVSRASKAFPEHADLIRMLAREKTGDFEIPGFPGWLGKQEANARLGAHLGQTSDEAITSIRASLSDQGETGVLGAARGLADLDAGNLRRLGEAYPEYRFERLQVADDPAEGAEDVIFGLRPDADVPSGTAEAPRLTDDVIEEYRQTGFLRDQRVLVGGVEHRYRRMADEGQVLVEPVDGGSPYPVDVGEVARLDQTEGLLRNPRLVQQFRQFRAAEGLGDNFEEAFERFTTEFADDLPERLQPHLRRFLLDQEAALRANRMRPSDRAAWEQFQRARRRGLREGHDKSLETFAAQRGLVVHRLEDGRIKFTNIADPSRRGRTTPPFRNEERAREHLQQLDWTQPDVAPSIPEVPDELMAGVLMRTHRPNPAHAPKAQMEAAGWKERLGESASGFADAVAIKAGPVVTDMEDGARILQRRGLIDVPLYEEAIQPLSLDLRVVQNRSREPLERLAGLARGTDDADRDLIKGWLRSETKEAFEEAHNMSPGLVAKAEQLRLLGDDVFDEFSTATGVDLSFDDHFRNYAPDWVNHQSETGASDVIEYARRNFGEGEDLPPEAAFFGEMWKSGEAQFLPQEDVFTQFARMIRTGMFKAHAGENFARARQFAKGLGEDNALAKNHLIKYLNGVRGGGSQTRDRIQEFAEEINARIGAGNRPDDEVRNWVNAFIDQTYGATIAFRPALVLRNMFQPQLLGGPFLGHGRVFRAQIDALKKTHKDWARRAGILEEREAFQFYEDVGEQVTRDGRFASWFQFNQRMRNLGMSPYSGADKHNRVATALAARRQAEEPLNQFMRGEINETELFNAAGALRVLDQPQRNKLFNILEGETAGTVGDGVQERALNFVADEVGSKLTNFMYGRRNAAPMLRSTVGRAFGAYSTWSRGYLNWLTQIASADAPASWKIGTLAKHGTAVSGLVAAGAAAGVNLSSWVSWNSLFFGGSPAISVAKDAHTVWSGLPHERERVVGRLAQDLGRVTLTGGQFALGDATTALERLGDDDPWGAFLETAGFRTLSQEDADPADAFRGLIPSPLQLPAGGQQDATDLDFGGGGGENPFQGGGSSPFGGS